MGNVIEVEIMVNGSTGTRIARVFVAGKPERTIVREKRERA
jgi:hypothetical protein